MSVASTTFAPLASASATGSASSTANNNNNGQNMQVDENEFLQLMITELKDQNPLSPQDPTDFLSQIAQFTSVEQETQTAQNTATTPGANTIALLGHTVTYTNSDGSTGSGTVSKVDIAKAGTATLTVGDVTGIAPTQVTQVS